ncbi:MAG TPA: M43 family zinc metalloprotease, partial [Bacteroidia bacterium]|nr:M43 family zinc metalloprotease [Bacteroidia bacterium]
PATKTEVEHKKGTPYKDWCGMEKNIAYRQSIDPTYKAQLAASQKQIDAYLKANPDILEKTKREQGVITIPVIVHVLYNNSQDPNEKITPACVKSQIDVLNQDYSRTNPDASSTPAAFASVAANVGVQFCMATTDPSGVTLANPGIEYVATTSTGFTTSDDAKSTSTSGANIWDNTKYINIWVCDLADKTSGVLGYGEFPTAGLDATFGVVCDYRCFGTTGAYLYSGYTKGRVMSHEFSHCFNLIHTFADDNGLCQTTGGNSDGCADTPDEGNGNSDSYAQNGATFGCPTYPYVDNCSTTSPGIMFMDFMDYTSDNCKNLFTNNQAARIISAINTFMPGFKTSTKCGASAAPVADFKANVTTIPVGAKINYTDLSTQAPTAWAWTFTGAVTTTSAVQNPTNIQYNTVGNYAASLKATNSFGNNTATKASYIHVINGNACDTLSNLPDNSLTVYETGNAAGKFDGWVTGCYGDTVRQIAEYFATPPATGFTIGSVYVYFAVASSKTVGRTVNVNIWDNTGTGGIPGTIKATKAVTISSINPSKGATLVTFTAPVTITTPYYVGVDFTTVAAAYKTDTIAIATDTNNAGPNTAWQYDVAGSLNGWKALNTVWTTLNLSHAIWVNMCSSPTEAYTYDLNEGVKLYPNPSNGIIN